MVTSAASMHPLRLQDRDGAVQYHTDERSEVDPAQEPLRLRLRDVIRRRGVTAPRSLDPARSIWTLKLVLSSEHLRLRTTVQPSYDGPGAARAD
jgi:hypothetical protein